MMNQTQLPKDPFEYKSLSKRNPIRIAHKIQAELLEYWSALTFKRAELPIKLPSESYQESLEFDREDTAVTDEHMRLLLDCIKETNPIGEPVAEIGAFRGVTSAMLAARTERTYYIIDPYAGYGGAETDLTRQRSRTASLPNISFHRTTSGQFLRDHRDLAISFAFIDAVHDFANVWFDGSSWSQRLVPGGLIAFHDTDANEFSGARTAVTKLLRSSRGSLTLFAHIKNLTVLQRAD
jgi:predicted O-methyltransferase YrrM